MREGWMARKEGKVENMEFEEYIDVDVMRNGLCGGIE